ncbi:MAG: hypothetical protein JKX75_06355 [Gammaproteobacteria bacterium]|nr:hypothetical protein [Gammaproteobacteria bacterium]
MDINNAPFIDYLNAVDDLLETKYGITSIDTNMDFIASCQEEGVSPKECVGDLAVKYGFLDFSEY